MLPFAAVHSNVDSILSSGSCTRNVSSFHLKSSQSILLPLHLIRSFFFLTCYVQLYVEFFGKSFKHHDLLSRIEWEWSFSLVTTSAPYLFCWYAEDMVGVVSEVDVVALTCNCSVIVVLKRYSVTWAASFFSKTSYFFGSRYFLLSLLAFFLAAS